MNSVPGGPSYLWEAGIVSLAHWSSFDRQICIVPYSDTMCNCNIYMIYSLYCITMWQQSLYYVYNLIETLKKKAISKQLYTLEYVTWSHKAKTSVNSILMEVF